MNILIAEDNPTIQFINRKLMDYFGFDFDIASNGLETIEYARANIGTYDLCMMDVEMPLMNGIDAAITMRRDLPYFPILALTASDIYKPKCPAAGMDDFVEKPCLPDQLLLKIQELTVKPLQMGPSGDNILIKEVMPMNSDELKELRELKKQGLTKLKLIGLNQAFIVHKNIQNKISHDLIGLNKELSEFIDRTPSEPGKCHLYKANLHITKDLLLPEELDNEIKKENEMALRFTNSTDQPIPEE